MRRSTVWRSVLAVVGLCALASSGARAQPCPGISPETARRMFDAMKQAAPGEGYRFEGLGTDGPKVEVRWSLRNRPCPPIHVLVENCSGPVGLTTLKVRVPPRLAVVCPGLKPVVRTLIEMAPQERAVGQIEARQSFGWWPILVLVVGLVGVAVVLAFRRSRKRALRPTASASSVRRWRDVALQIVVILALSEGAYRAVIWLMMVANAPPSDVFVLYGVGESTMVGEPFDDEFSLPSLVSERLGGQLEGRPIVTQTIAERGAGAYAQGLRFERALAYHDPRLPGAVLIYSGHNERYSPEPASSEERADVTLLLPVGGRVWSVIRHIWLVRDALLAIRSMQAMRPRPGLHPYERAIRRIIETANEARLTPVLFTLPSNWSGVEPNAYADHAPNVGPILSRGKELELAGQFGEALELYRREALTANPTVSLLLEFRMAQCELQLGQVAQARDRFRSIVDKDPRLNFGRATSQQNDLLRRLAAEYGIPLVDAAAAFEAASPNGIPGNALFSDGHHPSLPGYWILATSCAEAMHQRFGDAGAVDRALPRDLERALGISAKGRRRAHVASGSWLIGTAVKHPWPDARLELAEQHFREALGRGDDASAWLGIALSQAGRRAIILTDKRMMGLLARSRIFYRKVLRAAPQDRDELRERLRSSRIDPDVMAELETLWR